MYFIIPLLLILGIFILTWFAIKNLPPLITLNITLLLLLGAYLDFKTYTTQTHITNDFKTMCDENVCIIRIDNKNLTFEKKIDYDKIKNKDFSLEVEVFYDIFGNVNNKEYKLINK